jgi:hypothetical protein
LEEKETSRKKKGVRSNRNVRRAPTSGQKMWKKVKKNVRSTKWMEQMNLWKKMAKRWQWKGKRTTKRRGKKRRVKRKTAVRNWRNYLGKEEQELRRKISEWSFYCLVKCGAVC